MSLSWFRKRLRPKTKRKEKFEEDFGFSLVAKLLGHRQSYAEGRIQIPVVSFIIFLFWIAVLFIMTVFFMGTLLRTWKIFLILILASLLGSIFFTGKSGLVFLSWLGLRPSELRKEEVTPDNSPISLPLTRTVAYSVLGFQLAFWIFWMVFNMRPVVYPEGLTDRILINDITVTHYRYQFQLYFWVLIALTPICILAVRSLEKLPILNFIMLRTRILLLIVPVIAVQQIWMVLSWLGSTEIWVIPINI